MVIAALLIPPLLGALDQNIVATALPAIARRLGQPELLPWVVNAYLSTSTVSPPVLGMSGMAMISAKGSMLAMLALTVTGLGLGMTMQLLIALVQGAVGRTQIGVATSAATMFRALGGLFGLSVLGVAFASALPSGISHALHLVFVLATVAAAMQFALSWRLQDPPNAEPPSGPAEGSDARQDAAVDPA